MEKKKSYTPTGMLLPMTVLEVCSFAIKSVVHKWLPESLQEIERQQLSKFFNHMLVNSVYKHEEGSEINRELGRSAYGTIFGNRQYVVDGKTYRYGGEKAEGEVPRLLEALIARKIIFRLGYVVGRNAQRYILNRKFVGALGVVCLVDDTPTQGFMTLDKYTGQDWAPHVFSSVLNTVPQSKAELMRSSPVLDHMFDQDMDLPVNAEARRKLVEMYKCLEPLELDVSNIDHMLLSVLTGNRAWLASSCSGTETKKLQENAQQLLRIVRTESKFSRLTTFLEKAGPKFRTATVAATGFSRFLRTSSSLSRIISSGSVYYKRSSGRLYYYRTYGAKSNGGRSYENAGGFQTLPREFKQRMTDKCDGINFDIKSCHFFSLKTEMEVQGVAHLCPALRDAHSLDEIVEMFLSYAKRQTVSAFICGKNVDLDFQTMHLVVEKEWRPMVKVLFYANLNNGSQRIGLRRMDKTSAQIYKMLLQAKSGSGNPTHARQFLCRTWNEFCAGIGFFDMLRQLMISYVRHQSVDDGAIHICNAFGLTIRLPAQKEGKSVLVDRQSYKSIISHVMTGRETQRIYEFIRGNKKHIRVQALEHDGLYLRMAKGSSLNEKEKFNEGFVVKPFYVTQFGRPVL